MNWKSYDEKRAIRREAINDFLHLAHITNQKPGLSWIKAMVREYEFVWIGYELKLYE